MLETAASRGWKAKDAIEWFHGIDRLDRDLRPYLHHPPGWNLEEVGRIAGRFCERDKKTVLPARHA
jgi:hypothetical protein